MKLRLINGQILVSKSHDDSCCSMDERWERCIRVVFVTLKKYMKYVLLVGALFMVLSMCYYGFRGALPRAESQDIDQWEQAVAAVNGQKITRRQFLNAVASEMNNRQWYYGPVRPEQEEEINAEALERLITDRLLLQAVEEENVAVTQEELDAETQKLKEEFESEEEFNKWMDNVGVTLKILEDYFKDYVKVNKLIDSKMGVVEVTDADIQDYYEGVELSQIFVSNAEDSLTIAQEVHAKLIGGGDFAELAEEYSDDQSAFNGGSLGFVRRDESRDPKLMEAAFALEVGEISPIISTDDGHYILRVTEKRLVGDDEYEKNKDAIKEELINARKNQNVNQWFADYRKTANIEIFDNQMKAYNLVAEGKYDEALVEYEKAVAERPQDPYLRVSVARVYQQKGDDENVVKSYEAAVDLATSDANLRWLLGNAYMRVDRQDEAVVEFKKASELAYEDTYENMLLHFYLQMTYEQLGMKEEAQTESAILQKMQDVVFGQYEDEAESTEVPDGDVDAEADEDGE